MKIEPDKLHALIKVMKKEIEKASISLKFLESHLENERFT